MEFRSFNRVMLVSLALFVATASPVYAAFVSQDWQTAGDNLITLDNVTGLEWLDWSYTVNRSYSDVSSQFGVGGEFEGFRYAGQDELLTLYDNFGFGYPTGLDGDAANKSGIEDFTSLFGATFGAAASNWVGVEAWYDHSTIAGQHWITALNFYNGGVHPEWLQAIDSSTFDYVGSALVRNSISPVPVPAAVWLFGSALIGLVGFGRRRKAA